MRYFAMASMFLIACCYFVANDHPFMAGWTLVFAFFLSLCIGGADDESPTQ